MIEAMSRGRATGKVCSMVCGYDKTKARSDREARCLEHVWFESGGRDARSEPTEPAAYYERPRGGSKMFRKVPPPGVCAREPYLSHAPRAGRLTASFARGL